MNRNILTSLAAFAIGAAAGSVATWMIVKTKYERIAQEEIDSVKEVFSRELESMEKEVEEDEEPTIEAKTAELKNYKDVVKASGYTNYSNVDDVEEVEEIEERGNTAMVKDGPYIIPPNELGEEYPIYTLICYADGVITEYDSGEIVDDVEGAIGEGDIREHFGEYEEDSVFVRNDARKIDYEVLRDEDNYYDE